MTNIVSLFSFSTPAIVFILFLPNFSLAKCFSFLTHFGSSIRLLLWAANSIRWSICWRDAGKVSSVSWLLLTSSRSNRVRSCVISSGRSVRPRLLRSSLRKVSDARMILSFVSSLNSMTLMLTIRSLRADGRRSGTWWRAPSKPRVTSGFSCWLRTRRGTDAVDDVDSLEVVRGSLGSVVAILRRVMLWDLKTTTIKNIIDD